MRDLLKHFIIKTKTYCDCCYPKANKKINRRVARRRLKVFDIKHEGH